MSAGGAAHAAYLTTAGVATFDLTGTPTTASKPFDLRRFDETVFGDLVNIEYGRFDSIKTVVGNPIRYSYANPGPNRFEGQLRTGYTFEITAPDVAPVSGGATIATDFLSIAPGTIAGDSGGGGTRVLEPGETYPFVGTGTVPYTVRSPG